MAIQRVFRKDYIGEFIVHSRNLENGIYTEDREWVPNTVQLDIESDSAVVIGNGESRKDFDLEYIRRHSGGHLKKHKLYSYGCNALYRDFAPDFLIATNDGMVDEIIDSRYADDHMVYTINRYVSRYPGKFHLIPYHLQYNSGTMATFLAAFDGFKKIYLLGFDTQGAGVINTNIYRGTKNYPESAEAVCDDKRANNMVQIFRHYPEVEFYRVMPGDNPDTPSSWLDCLNFKNINFKQFISYADL